MDILSDFFVLTSFPPTYHKGEKEGKVTIPSTPRQEVSEWFGGVGILCNRL